jgi:hypothetical protein
MFGVKDRYLKGNFHQLKKSLYSQGGAGESLKDGKKKLPSFTFLPMHIAPQIEQIICRPRFVFTFSLGKNIVDEHTLRKTCP